MSEKVHQISTSEGGKMSDKSKVPTREVGKGKKNLSGECWLYILRSRIIKR